MLVGTNVRGFRGLSLSTNLHPYEHVFVSTIILINIIEINYLLPTILRSHEPVKVWLSTNHPHPPKIFKNNFTVHTKGFKIFIF
jgi:hypothetical protein